MKFKLSPDKLLLLGSLILGIASGVVEDKKLDRLIDKKLNEKKESD